MLIVPSISPHTVWDDCGMDVVVEQAAAKKNTAGGRHFLIMIMIMGLNRIEGRGSSSLSAILKSISL